MAKWLSRDLIGFSITSLFNDLSDELALSFLPAFVVQLTGPGTASFWLGLITGLADATSTFMKLFSGFIAQRISFYKPLILLGYSIAPVCVGLIGTAHSIWQVLVYQILSWTGKGLRDPLRDVWLANISLAKDYGKVFGLQRAFDSIGAVLGPLAAYYAIQTISIRAGFYLALIPGIASVVALILLTNKYRNTIFLEKISHWREKLSLLPKSFILFLSARFLFGIGNFHRTLLVLWAHQMILGQESSWILATGTAISFYSILNATRALAEFCMGTLSDYIDRKIVLALGGFWFFALTNSMLLLRSEQFFIWICIFIVAGLSIGTVTSLEKSFTAYVLPPFLRGIGFGIQQSLNGISNLIAGFIVGGLWSILSPEAAFIYASITSIFAGILLLNSFRQGKNISTLCQ